LHRHTISRFIDRRLLTYARRERLDLLLTVALGALSGVLIVLAARLLAATVNGVFLGGLALADVWSLLVALTVIAVVRALLLWGGELTANRVATRVKTDLRERLTAHLLALGPAYARGERTGELVNTAVEGIEALDAYFSQYLPQLALAVLIPVTFLLVVFPLDPLSGLVLLLTAPLIPVFMILIGSLADGLTRRQWTALSRMSAHFLDVLQGLTTLKLFNRSREQIAVIAEISDRYRDTTFGVLRVAFLSALVLEMVGTLGTAVIAVEIGLRLLYGRLAFEQAFFVLILAPEFYLPLRLLGTRFHAGIAGVTAARRVFEVLETPVGGGATRRHGDVERGFAASPRRSVAVSFTDVHYAYDQGSRPALNGVSFEIRPGEKVALVGPTGAGKSTLAHLLLGFIAPMSGHITVTTQAPAAADVIQLPASSIELPTIAWVPQLPYLFNTSVVENIRLGRAGAGQDDVVRAAQQAGADDFIRALPQGYETVIGEQGARLSGGQAQRIALARAFLLDAPLVILDEATANLDPESEALIQTSLERLLAGRTALIIAHRLNTVRSADRILVLDHGHVAETGTHAELMARAGLYRWLVEAGSGAGGAEEQMSPTGRLRAASRGAEEQDGIRNTLPTSARSLPGGRSTQHAARSTFQDIRRLLSFLAPYWPWIGLSVLLGFVTVGSSIGLMAASAWIIATAALHPSIAVLQVAIVGVRFFGIARGVFRYLERLASHQVTFRVLARLRVWFYAALEPLAPARLMQYRSGDLLSRIVADIGTLENFYIRAVAPPLVALLVAGLMWVFLGSFDPRLALVVIMLMLLAGAGLPLLSQMLSRQPGRRMVAIRADLNAALVDVVQGTADLIAFGAGAAQVRQVRSLSAALGSGQMQLAAVNGLNTALGSLLTSLAVIAVLALAIPLVTAGRIAEVSLAVLALATAASFEAFLPLPLAAQFLENSLAAARRLFEVVDVGGLAFQSAGVYETGSEAALSVSLTKAPSVSIEVSHLTLRYAPGEPPALDDITFGVPAGGCVAIVGASGAGKSTLANALLRFWDPEAGEIRLNGRDLRDVAPESVRQQIGVVAQHTHLFNATIGDNLRLSRPDASQAEIEAAVRAAQIHDWISSLAEGYDTWVGEQGLRLSGGERQRLAIARALLKNAPVLILDEPTANLDTATERDLLAALAPLMVGRTTLIITHRLVGLERADKILVFERGRIVERGRHEMLLRRAGAYRRMWDLQRQQF
jgi:ATP-binding cassette, subfamily C, bacterial CydCD